MPFFLSTRRQESGSLRSLKLLTGGGMSSPSTMMCHARRTSARSSSDMWRMWLGAFQPVSKGSVYCHGEAAQQRRNTRGKEKCMRMIECLESLG